MRARSLLLMLVLGMLSVPSAVADHEDPPGCIGGYNPDALSNVCIGEPDPTLGPDNLVCPIGNICVPDVHTGMCLFVEILGMTVTDGCSDPT